MTTRGNGQPALYDVRMSEQNKAVLKDLHRKAAERGIGAEVLAAARQAIDRLRKAPLEFGERLYRLPALKLILYVAAVKPLIIHYGVHEEKPLVFIRGFNLMD